MTNTLTINSLLKGEHKSLIFVLLILAVIYFPFANKAFTVDDTLFLKAAEQILVKPLDFSVERLTGTVFQHRNTLSIKTRHLSLT